MLARTLMALAAAGLISAPVAAQGTNEDRVEQNAIAETFGIEPGPENFRDIEIDGLSAEALAGSEILDRSGEKVGTVADILIVEGDADKVVLAVDGGFGDARRRLLIPLDEVQIQKKDDETFRVRTTLTDATIDQLTEYDAA